MNFSRTRSCLGFFCLHFFSRIPSPLRKRLGNCVRPQFTLEVGQVFERFGHVRVLEARGSFRESSGTLSQFFRPIQLVSRP